MIGQVVSHYKIMEKLGGGGMGVVYRAEDTRLKRQVALKFLPLEFSHDAEAKTRFVHEAQAASALDHPNICNIHEIDETKDGQMFLCMTLYDGETLKKKIRQGPLSVDQVIHIAFQIARGLERAHEAGIIHRDLKPANIMLTAHNEAKIVDFGLAKLSGRTEITRKGSPLGTINYMSPEQARGEELDTRTDIWSFGIILYEMLCGEPPFTGEYDQAVVYSILNEPALPLQERRADIPEQLIRIVEGCLKKDRESRFSSVKDIFRLLQEVQPSGARRDQPQYFGKGRIKKWKKSRYFLLSAVVLMVIAVIIVWQMMFGLPKIKHVAVLPFTMIGADQETEAFCDGILETITSRLAQLKQYNEFLEVIPSNTIRRYDVRDPEKAAQRLGATLVISGSIDKRESFTQFILNLIDTRSLRLIRSEDFRVDMVKPDFQLEEKLIGDIIVMLELEISHQEKAEMFSVGTRQMSAYDYYLRGRGYLERSEKTDNIDTAIRLFERALESDSLFTLAYTGIGEAWWKKYNHTKDTLYVKPALKACNKAMLLNGKYAESYVTCGTILKGMGKYDQAIEKLQRAIALDPANAPAYRKLGQTMWAAGDTLAAIHAYQRAILQRPADWQGYSHLGVFFLRTGRYQEAIEAFQKVVNLLPDSDIGYNNLAATYFYLERVPQAIKMGEEALKREPSYIAYHNLASYYYYSGKYEQAAEKYHQVLKFNNQDYRIWGALATSYYFTQRLDSAFACYQKAIERAEGQRKINPNAPDLLVCLAGYHARLEQREKAYALLKQAENLKPVNLDVFFNIGDIYEQLGEREEALVWMEKAIKNNYKLARFKNNPGLKKMLADERFEQLLVKYNSTE